MTTGPGSGTTLFVNARVLTMDATCPVAEAFAIRGSRIVEVGTRQAVDVHRAGATVVDLGGRAVTPGFVDPHNHFAVGALECFWADCRDTTSIDEIQRRLATAAAKTPAGEWVRGLGYDHNLLPGRRHPTRGELDAAVPDRPVLLLHYSHHQAVANTRALGDAGITRATPDPRGGEIGRDKAGEPTGLLFERAMSTAEARSREGAESRFVDVAAAASREFARHGITTLQDAAVTPAMAARYAAARRAGALAVQVDEMMVGSAGWFERPDDAAPGRTLKLFVDGGYRCAIRLPRDGRTSGFLFYERDELAAILVAAWRAGRRVTCHAIGNLGIERAIDAIGDALLRVPAGRELVRIDHAMFLTDDLIARIRDLGLWVVEQPSFLYDVGGVTPAPEIRLRPFRTLRDRGVRQAFSSDFPCGALAPLVGVYAAVTRKTKRGDTVEADEAISVDAALEAYTLGAAIAAGLDRDCGSLVPGKRADFLVLSDDPRTIAPERLLTVDILETWIAGARVPRCP